MKIAGFEVTALNIPEDDPLANMPEEAGRCDPLSSCGLEPTTASKASV